MRVTKSMIMIEEMLKYKPYLLTIARKKLVVSNQMWAEDLVHETFYKAGKSIDQYNGDIAKISTWLASITKNLCIDFNRKKVNNEVKLQCFNSFESHNYYASRKNTINIRKYLAELPDRDQKLLRMKYFFDMSSKEMAQIIGVSPNNVPMLIKRAKDKLFKVLMKNGVRM